MGSISSRVSMEVMGLWNIKKPPFLVARSCCLGSVLIGINSWFSSGFSRLLSFIYSLIFRLACLSLRV